MEVQIPQFNKNIDKNREFGLHPIADEDLVTIQLDQDSTIKDIRDKLSRKLQINNESIILHWVGVAEVAVKDDDSLIFRPSIRSEARVIGARLRGNKLYSNREQVHPLSFRIDYSPSLREHVELLKANKRLAYSKMNEKFDDTDVFREVTKYLKGGKKKRRKKRKTKSRRKSKSRTKSRRKSKSKGRSKSKRKGK